MLINYEINTNLEINCLTDLNKLKDLQNNGLKVNKSALARRLGKDRRTINKYINGYQKSNVIELRCLMSTMISSINF